MGVRHLNITGGEPLVRKDVFDIIELAIQQGLRVHLATNGSLVEQHRERLAGLKLASVFTSVDGLEEIWHHGFQRYRQPVLPEICYECRHLHACGGGTLGMRVGDRHCLKRLWEGEGHA